MVSKEGGRSSLKRKRDSLIYRSLQRKGGGKNAMEFVRFRRGRKKATAGGKGEKGDA